MEKGLKPDDCKGRWNSDSLFHHFTTMFSLLKDDYDTRFSEVKDATDKALAAVKEQTNAAFAANKESVLKTEEAQREYNHQHNDLTRKMEAQAAKFIDREKLEDLIKQMDARFETYSSQIINLQESRAAGGERRMTQQEHRQQANFTITQIITVIFGLLGVLTFGLALAQFFMNGGKP
jgi:hypothetical protein